MSARHHLIGVRNKDQKLTVIDSTGGDDAYEFLKTQRSVAAQRFSELEIISDADLIARYGADHEIVTSSRLEPVPRRMCWPKTRRTHNRRSAQGQAPSA